MGKYNPNSQIWEIESPGGYRGINNCDTRIGDKISQFHFPQTELHFVETMEKNNDDELIIHVYT